jgi:hypothetical protein
MDRGCFFRCWTMLQKQPATSCGVNENLNVVDTLMTLTTRSAKYVCQSPETALDSGLNSDTSYAFLFVV